MVVYVDRNERKRTGIDKNGNLVIEGAPPTTDDSFLWNIEGENNTIDNASNFIRDKSSVKYVEILKKRDPGAPTILVMGLYSTKGKMSFSGNMLEFLRWASDRKKTRKLTILVFYDLVKIQERMNFPIYSIVKDFGGVLIFDMKLFTKNIGLESRLTGKVCSIKTMSLPHHSGIDFSGTQTCLWSLLSEKDLDESVRENRDAVCHFMSEHGMISLFTAMCIISKSSWNQVMEKKGLSTICNNVFRLNNEMSDWVLSEDYEPKSSKKECQNTKKRNRDGTTKGKGTPKFKGGEVITDVRKGLVRKAVSLDFRSMYLEVALSLDGDLLPDFKRKSISSLLDMKYNSTGVKKTAAKSIGVNVFGNTGKKDSPMCDFSLAAAITGTSRKHFKAVRKFIENELGGKYLLGHTDGFTIGLTETVVEDDQEGKDSNVEDFVNTIITESKRITNGLVLKKEHIGCVLILSSTNYVIQISEHRKYPIVSSCKCPDLNCGDRVFSEGEKKNPLSDKHRYYPQCLLYHQPYVVKGGLMGRNSSPVERCLFVTVFFPWCFSLLDTCEGKDQEFYMSMSYKELTESLKQLVVSISTKIEIMKEESVWFNVIYWIKTVKISNVSHKDSFPLIHKCYRENEREVIGKNKVNLFDYVYGKRVFDPNDNLMEFICEISKICVSFLNQETQSEGKSVIATNIANVLYGGVRDKIQ